MFYVKIVLKESPIHGIGLFANEDIPKGKIIYSANPKLDLNLTREDLLKMSLDEIKTIKHYGYLDKIENKWRLSFDNIRFCNHSSDGNITSQENRMVAKKNIKKGDELTQDYKEFEKLREELI